MSLITYEDSLAMPENKLEEILHGESRIMPPATRRHVNVVEKLGAMLRSLLDERDSTVIIAGAGLGIERDPLTYRIPDLMVFRTEVLRQDEAGAADNDPYIWTVPELLVECLSPSNRKGSVRELLADYAQIAVPEVWLLDPAIPQFTSYRYESAAPLEFHSQDHGAVSPLLLPNMTVDLDELWAAFHGRLK
ncbi:MAG: Uma2 family endonuclease [Bryobacteraceae bacterium]|jgi:Uma2 family endonuclease